MTDPLKNAATAANCDLRLVTVVYQSLPRSDESLKVVLRGDNAREILKPVVHGLIENQQAAQLAYYENLDWRHLHYSGLATIIIALQREELVDCNLAALKDLPTDFEFSIDAYDLEAPIQWNLKSMIFWTTVIAIAMSGFIRSGMAGAWHTIGGAFLIVFGALLFHFSRLDKSSRWSWFGTIYAGFIVALGLVLFWYVISGTLDAP